MGLIRMEHMERKNSINILFIADPNSLHNRKWMRHFGLNSARFRVFLCCETQETPSEAVKKELLEEGITFLTSLQPFSIRTPFRNLAAYDRFKRLTQQWSIDCVHVLFATPYALWLRNYTGKCVISTRGSDILQVIPSLTIQKGIKKGYYAYLFTLFYRSFYRASLITSTSHQQADAVHHWFKKRATCIRTGVDVAYIKEIDPNYPVQVTDCFNVFSPRFMQPLYDILFQVEALEHMEAEELTKIHFLCIQGKKMDADYWNRVELRLKKLEEKGLLWHVLSYLEQDAMFRALKAADLVIMTPKSDGTPNSALECMAAGTPLIISDLPYDPELFEGTCLKVTNRTPAFLANLIRSVMQGKYPDGMLEKASEQVAAFGNRALEMHKLEELIYPK